MTPAPLPSASRIVVGAPQHQGAFAFAVRGVRPSSDDFPRASEQPAVVLDIDDNARRAVGALLAEARR